MNSRRATAAALLALAGCQDCPPDPHVITGMRVLGAVATPAVGSPGAAVTLRAVAVDVKERDLEVAWYRCPESLLRVESPLGGVEIAERFAAQVERCLRAGEVARGPAVSVTFEDRPALRDTLPLRPPRLWNDVVGFACAGGSIEPAPEGGAWPRCTGSRGVVFTASVPGPLADGTNPEPAPLALEDLTFGGVGAGAGAAWTEAAPPEVPRCEGPRGACAPWEVRFRVRGATSVAEVSGDGATTPSLGFSEGTAFVGYHVTAMAPASVEGCVASDPGARVVAAAADRARFRWYAPAEAGEVTFWLTARRFTGSLTWARRVVRVR